METRRGDLSLLMVLPYFVMASSTFVSSRIQAKVFYPLYILWFLFVFLARARWKTVIAQSFGRFIIPMTLYMFVLFILQHMGRQIPMSTSLGLGGLCLLEMFVFHYCIAMHRQREMKVVLALSLLLFGISSIMMLNFDIGATRSLASGIASAATVEDLYRRIDLSREGLVGYGSAYALVFIVIALIGYWREFNRRWKIAVLIFIPIFLIGIYRAAFSLAILILGIGVVFLSIRRLVRSVSKFNRLLFAISVVFVLVVAHPTILSPFSAIPRALAELTEVPEYRYRLMSMAESWAGVTDTYANLRSSLYADSFAAFVQNPLLGYSINSKYISRFSSAGDELRRPGGHSTLFDTAAYGGLMLLLPLIIAVSMYFRYITYIYRANNCQDALKTWHCCFYSFIILASMNPVSFYDILMVVFFIVPSIPLAICPRFSDRANNAYVRKFGNIISNKYIQ